MRVYSRDFEYLYRITRFLAAQEIKRYVGKSVFVLKLAASDDAAYYLQKNGWIVMDDGDPYIIKHIKQEVEQVTITAYGGHQLLTQRVTVPPGGLYAIAHTGSADAVVKHFINQSVRGATLVTSPAQGGATISDQSRLKPLGDEVARILSGSGRGEKYTFDADNKRIVFDTYLGADRSRGNALDNPPVVFDLKYKNIDKYTYTEDATKEQTTVYVGGQGEGVERDIIVTGDQASGNDRVEVFVDARDVEQGDVAKLTERAAQSTIQTAYTIAAEAVSDANLVYGVDYGLGDIVTTNVPAKSYAKNGDYYDPVDTTIQVNQRITEVTISREGGLEHIDLTFGEQPLTQTQVQRLQAEVAQLKSVDGGNLTSLSAHKVGDYYGIKLPDGSDQDWLRTTAYGLIPHSPGQGHLGTSGWPFDATYANTVYAKNAAFVGSNPVWHAGNDGEGSGLDADSLDGRHRLDFAEALILGSSLHLNDMKSSGMFGVYGREEAPFGAGIQAIEVVQCSVDWVVQIAYHINSDNARPKRRMYHSGSTWTAWASW